MRDAGMQQAVDNANKAVPAWSDRAFTALQEFLRQTSKKSFMAEDIRDWAHKKYGLPLAPSNRAWGSIIGRAANQGLIRKIGISQVNNPLAHRANAALWVKV